MERADVALTFQNCIWDVCGLISARLLTILQEIFSDLPQYLLVSTDNVSRIGHGRFLPNFFQCIILLSPYLSILCDADTSSIVKTPTEGRGGP
jgi:hypothetical protein